MNQVPERRNLSGLELRMYAAGAAAARAGPGDVILET